MTDLYRKAKSLELLAKSREVFHWDGPDGEAVQFRCPCGERLVYVKSPPHTIEFWDDGILASLGGSCGYRVQSEKNRPANWCHFTITDGIPTIHGDARCPGGDNSIP